MEHLDRFMPLAILLGVAAFLLFLLRRTAREQDGGARFGEMPPVLVPVMAPPVAVFVQATEVKRQRARNNRAPAEAQTGPVQTPIHTVLGLLKDKDALAAAFLLHEILAPPVSKR